MTIQSTNKWGGDTSPLQARPQPRWTRSPNVVDRPTRQGVMVLAAEGPAVMLTGVAARVWQALARPARTDELAGWLAQPSGAGAGDAADSTADQLADALRHLQAIGAVRETR
jgi:hypothetical protein